MKLYPKTRLGRERIKSKDFFTAKAAKISKVEIFLRKWFPLEFLGSNRVSWIGS